MKNLFLISIIVLVAFSQVMNWRSMRQLNQSNKPYIIWVGRVSQDKPVQVKGFHDWLKQKGYQDIDVRFDENNAQTSKVIIQGLSGLGGDVMDTFGAQLQYFSEIGIIKGFEKGAIEKLSGTLDSERYAPYTNETDFDNKEYGVPFNLAVEALLVNRDLFKKADVRVPELTCDHERFEKIGKELVAKLNPKGKPQSVYLSTDLKPLLISLMRSGGTSIFNETLTASAVNRDQNFSKVLATLLKWTYVDHLIPTPAELASLTQANSGYMNPQWQEFAQNHFGLLSGSRFLLMPLRELKCTNELDAILPPNWGYPTCISSTRYLTVYRGSEKNESTALFAAYLRSDAYNQLIIDGGDNLPPIPKFMDSASYMNPPTHPNEAKLNQNIKKIAMNYALGREDSPFVLYMNITKYINYAYESVVSRIATPEAAVKELDKSINKEIAAYVKRHPEKQADYESALSTQKRIDATLSNGQKLDLKDVRNLFLKKYYQDTGRAQ